MLRADLIIAVKFTLIGKLAFYTITSTCFRSHVPKATSTNAD